MQTERWSGQVQALMQAAQVYALGSRHPQITSYHILWMLLNGKQSDGYRMLAACCSQPEQLQAAVKEKLEQLPRAEQRNNQQSAPQIGLGQDVAELLVLASKAADQANSEEITLAHLLLGLVQLGSEAGELLRQHQVSEAKLTKALNEIGQQQQDSVIKKFTRDFTEEARQGRLDPVIGRDEEIRRAIQILSRRTKNNPVLIGDPGVGKTAIAEGLAQRLVKNDVPITLRDKTLLGLDLASLLAGSKFRGEFEERIQKLLKEISANADKYICFIDELHTLVGAGATEGAMDAANMLKPALARGDLRCIGATTLIEYRQHIAKDPALARRFQTLYVNEPSLSETVSILRGLKEKYELHHGVQIRDQALVAAAKLADRYISNRFMPDKAIDLIDEAASRVRMQIDSKPDALDECDRRIMQLRMEISALQKEGAKEHKNRLAKLNTELTQLQERSKEEQAKWQATRQRLAMHQGLQEKIEQARFEREQLQQQGELERAAELSYSIIPQLEQQLSRQKVEDEVSQQETVTGNDVATVVARWTGIPVEKMLTNEQTSLRNLDTTLGSSVIGQPHAITAVVQAVRRARTGLADPLRPLGSFLFMGPTGVGKTELAKALAAALFNSSTALQRFDMSEYMEKHAVAKLIGAPPGYVGYEQGGTLTSAVRERPYKVILLDEIEKAHPEVLNVLLQVMDNGKLTDGQGNTVDFRNVILIMTSNIAAEVLMESDTITESMRQRATEQLQNHLRPEFINRLDEIILFERLQQQQLRKILDIQLARLRTRLTNQRIELQVTDRLANWLAGQGYDPRYGARPLKRVLQRQLEDKLADFILNQQAESTAPTTSNLGGESDESQSQQIIVADLDNEQVSLRLVEQANVA